MKRYASWVILGCLAAGLTAAERPNILFIMSDDHAAPAIGAYGKRFARLNPTPNLDRLAGEGLLFRNCFCTNSICSPSRATILTGQYSQTNGVIVLDIPLPPERHTLPIVMKRLGYQTAMIGKWHLHTEPNFDFYQVLPGQGKYFDPVFRTKGRGAWPDNLVKTEGHSSDVITDLTLDWLKHRDRSKPFFLMHHYKAPHDWFQYAPRYQDYLADTEIPEPSSLYNQPYWGSVATRGPGDSLIHRIGTSVSPRHTIRSYAGMFPEIDPNQPEAVRTHEAYQLYLKKYLRCVKGVDDNLGRLFAYLRAAGLWDNTIILYTGDQGMMFGEHDLQDKRWMYDESMQMPLIVHYPPWIREGRASDLLVNNTDFAPTMIAMAGGTAPDSMQGMSFLDEIQGRHPATWRTATYYRYWMHMIHHDVPAHFGLRTRDYKLIFFYGRHYDPAMYGRPSMSWLKRSNPIEPTPVAWEFYDLRHDPEEMVNRYGDPRYREVIHALKAELRRQREVLHETDEAYPEIQRVIEAHWND